MKGKSLPTRSSWVKSRRSLVSHLMEQIHLRFGRESAAIEKYRKAYEKDMARRWKVSRRKDVLDAVAEAEFVFGGDFHAFSQSARSHLRVLRELPQNRPVVLGLEALAKTQQALVDQWLKGELEDAEFREKLQWRKSWGFPLEITWPLLKLAQERRYKILALSPPAGGEIQDLPSRDKFAASLLTNSWLENKGSLHYVIFGDLHIAQSHLPGQVRKMLGPNTHAFVSLYMNPEGVYFRLAKQGLHNDVEVVKFNSTQFGLLSSPPWVKWQSYLMYLEENYDQGIHDFDAGVDHTEHVASLIRLVAEDLGEEIPSSDLSVYSAQDESVESLIEHKLSGDELPLAQEMIKTNMSLYLPAKSFMYLAQPTVNHAASLAGQHVFSSLNKSEELFWKFPEDFEVFRWMEACSYFLSKLINPKRKPLGLHDLRSQMQAFQSVSLSKQALLLALDKSFRALAERKGGKELPKAFESDHPMVYIAVGRFLGAKWGERIFEAVQSHDLSVRHLVELMKMPPRQFIEDSISYRALAELTDKPSPVQAKRVRW